MRILITGFAFLLLWGSFVKGAEFPATAHEWELKAAHRIGFIPEIRRITEPENKRRKIIVWLYVKNLADKPRRFATHGFSHYSNMKMDHPTMVFMLEDIENPLKENAIVSSSEYAVMEVPPGQSVLIRFASEILIAAKAGMRVRLSIEDGAAAKAGVDELLLECESRDITD